MKICLCCGASVQSETLSCPLCGEASFAAATAPAKRPEPAEKADEKPAKKRR